MEKEENKIKADMEQYYNTTSNREVVPADTEIRGEVGREEGKQDLPPLTDKEGDIYVAGWRPLIGWIGAIGIGFNSVVVPILNSFGLDIKPIDTEAIIAMVAGVLGIATMRTYEKNKNIDTKEIKIK
jgi:hypothetical protein